MISEEYTEKVSYYYTRYIGEHPEIRLGQFLCNEFVITDSEIFYEEIDVAAMNKFEEKYVDKE